MSNSKNYINIYVKINEEFYEILGSFMSVFPIVGIEEKLDEVLICFDEVVLTKKMLDEVKATIKNVTADAEIIKIEKLQDRNWNAEWEKGVSPIIIDDEIAITPDWHADSLNHKLKILINPKMSFGTGHHATTRLMCKMMKNLVAPSSFWIDAGTGTAVLAVLVVQLGADRVFAFDNDHWAVNNSIENIKMNHCSDKITISQEDVFKLELPECDGIAANMYTHILTRIFPKFYSALKKSNGDLIISGVLVYDEDEIYKSAKDNGFKHINTLYEDEWIAVHFKPESD